jgi:hypothetical protein
MKATLIRGLNEKDMQAVVNSLTLNAFSYPTLFPLKFNPTLTWKAIQADLGVPVAADVVAYNSSAPKKTRQVVSRLTGDIPKIEISRVKEETDLNEYYQLLHWGNTPEGTQAILDWIYDDVEFCYTGVNARLEWLAMQALSLGKIALSKTNNAGGVVTETAVDFLVPTANKSGVAVTWTSGHSATGVPITNIRAIVKLAKAAGHPVKYMLMDQDTFDVMCLQDSVIKFAASWVLNATSLAPAPTLAQVNAALNASNLPTIIIMDTYVTIELETGVRSTVNPFTTGVVTFLPDLNPGNTYYAPLAEELVEATAAIKVKRGPVLLKKYSLDEPSIQEVTKGMANAFPVWATAQWSYLMYALDTSWSL